MNSCKYKILSLLLLLTVCNSAYSQLQDNSQKMIKYIVEKTLYWNQYVDVIETTEDKEVELLLQYERKELLNQGTLNFLANENLDKHYQLTEYLRDSMQINNEFKLNDAPYILADFQMPNNLSLIDTENILKITGKRIYRLHKVEKSDYGKFCIILSEDYGFEGLNYLKMYENITETKKAVTKILTEQIAYYRPKFVDIEESHSKSKDFIDFKSQFKYFYFYEGYLIFQPLKETLEKIGTMSENELYSILNEINEIIKYSGNSDVYKIEKI